MRLAPYACGFALYWAWLMLSFYVTSPFSDNVSYAPLLTNLAWFCSASGHAIVLVFFIVKPHVIARFMEKRSAIYAFGALVASGSLFGSVGFIMSAESSIWMAISVLSFLVAGGTSAFLAVAWGMKLLPMSRKDISYVNALTLIIAGGIHLLLSSINSITMLAVVISLPLLSSVILIHAPKPEPADLQSDSPEQYTVRRSFGIAIPLVTCALYALCGELLRNASASSVGVTTMGVYYDFGLIIGSAVIIASEYFSQAKPAITDKPHNEFNTLKPMFMAMALAFMITVIFSMPYYFAYLCFAVGFAGLRIYAWLYCNSIINRFGLNPVRVFSVMLASFSLGPSIASPIMHLIALNDELWGKIVLSMICVMFFIVMQIMDGTKYASVWGLVEKQGTASNELGRDFSFIAEKYGLTARESQVAQLLAQGRSLPYIEAALTISSSTAQTHQRHIYAKMNVHNRQDFIDLVHKSLSIESSDSL